MDKALKTGDRAPSDRAASEDNPASLRASWAEMTGAAAPSSRSAVILLVLMTVLALPYFWSSTFSGFPWFDDEGTILISFRAFVEGHRMYDDVYSLYGPLYNIFYGLLYGPLHIPLNHVAGRLIAMSLWLAWTAEFAFFCFLLSRSLVSMLLCFVLTVRVLAPIMESSGHPEELCLVLIGATLLMTCWLEKSGKNLVLAGLGAAIAALSLIKINVGIFIGLPLLIVLLRKSSNQTLRMILAPAAMIFLILLPVALQSPLFSFTWVRTYSLFCLLSVAATCLVILTVPGTPGIEARSWRILVASGGVTALLIVGAMMLAGSSAFGILNAVVLQNAGFIRNWYNPIHLGTSSILSATLSLFAAGAYWISGARPKLLPYRKHAILAMQSIFILVGLWLSFRNIAIHIITYLGPFCWLLMTSPDADATPFRTARSVTALIGATMLLYAFPVAGLQMNIVAVFPLVALAVLSRDVASTLSILTTGVLLDACRDGGPSYHDGRFCNGRGGADLLNGCRTRFAWHVPHPGRSPAGGGPPVGEQPAVEMLCVLLCPRSLQLFLMEGRSVADDPQC